MRVALALLTLALTACSSDPVPADVPPVDVGTADAVDVLVAVDRAAGDVVDAGGADVPVAVADAGLDAPAVVDLGALLDVPVAVADAGVDAGVDVPGVDVVDVPPADVPRDTGPVDGGPRVYDLDDVRTEMSAVLLWGLVCASRDCSNDFCDVTVTPGECRLASDGLHFGLTGCGTVAGLASVGGAGTVTISGGGAPAQSSSVATTQGQPYTTGGVRRRNFHVQFAATAGAGSAGATGIPGRTVSPTLGDVWLFGCRVD